MLYWLLVIFAPLANCVQFAPRSVASARLKLSLDATGCTVDTTGGSAAAVAVALTAVVDAAPTTVGAKAAAVAAAGTAATVVLPATVGARASAVHVAVTAATVATRCPVTVDTPAAAVAVAATAATSPLVPPAGAIETTHPFCRHIAVCDAVAAATGTPAPPVIGLVAMITPGCGNATFAATSTCSVHDPENVVPIAVSYCAFPTLTSMQSAAVGVIA